jgi:hypothetical protein
MQDCSCVFSQQCCQDGAYYTDVFLNVNTYLQNKYKKMQIYYKYRAFKALKLLLKPLVALFLAIYDKNTTNL